MTTLVRAPVDAAELVRLFYQADPDITAITTVNGVYTRIPKRSAPSVPCLRIHQFDMQNVVKSVLHLTQHFLQVDAYASRRSQAVALGGLAAALAYELPGVHTLGVVTGVEVVGGNETPDDPVTVAPERWRFDLTVWAHPYPQFGS